MIKENDISILIYKLIYLNDNGLFILLIIIVRDGIKKKFAEDDDFSSDGSDDKDVDSD